MGISKKSKELPDFLSKKREEAFDLRNEMNRDFAEKTIATIREKRAFFQNIALASATLLGLASVFSSMRHGGVFFPYLFVGLSLHAAVICLVVMYLREVIDRDLESLRSLQDHYGKMLDETIQITERYKILSLNQPNENEVINLFEKYKEDLQALVESNKTFGLIRMIPISGLNFSNSNVKSGFVFTVKK